MKNLFKKFCGELIGKAGLELRPNVWSDYLIELNNLRKEFKIIKII